MRHGQVCAAGRDQVINQKDLLSGLDGVLMDLQCSGAVLQLVFYGDCFTGEFTLLADQDKGLVQVVGNGRAEAEASGLSAGYNIKIHILDQFLHFINGQPQSVSVLQDTGDVTEHDAGLREIRNCQYIIF